jgi:ketosteroid isomerase-like protein
MPPSTRRAVIDSFPNVAFRRWRVPGLVLAAGLVPASLAGAQWSRVYDTFYLPASHNWSFRNSYPSADRLFNAFDYGHAILYEKLLTRPGNVGELEEKQFQFVTTKLLVQPPRVPLEEVAIAPAYAKLVPEARAMFEWAHILHRQAYDVLSDATRPAAAREASMRELLAYYRTRRDLALSERPKSMALMQEQPYSLAFRNSYPKFNGLIWAYHWLQVGLYEPLLVARSDAERQTMIHATVDRFRQMLPGAPSGMPVVMPMTAAVAPTFAARYPEFAIIFDNLHSMHDVISDILANPSVPGERKRAEILRAARRYRDDTTEVMTVAAWRNMSRTMGLENQGGPAIAFGAALAVPTVARGAVMKHDREGNMVGGEHAGHAARDTVRKPADEHAAHEAAARAGQASDSQRVVRVMDAFHAALAAGDSAAALALLDDDVAILEAGGRETKAQYRGGHLRGDMAFARAVPRERGSMTVRLAGDVAWATSTSTARGTMNGREVNSRGAELVVLERRESQWRIVAIHWSSGRR